MRHALTLRAGLVAAAIGLILGACDLTVPDLNNPGLGDLTDHPTRASVVTAAQGLLVGARTGYGEFNRYVSALGVLGRESYIFDPSDPRFFSELLQGPLDPGGASFGGGGHWADRYRNIRSANVLLDAVDNGSALFSTEEQAALRGFAHTIMALDLLLVVNTRDDFGAPIDVNRDPTGEPAPIADTTEVYDRIIGLLDDAAAELQAGGSAFPFALSSGFTGFDTPATFRQFTRALESRVLVYRRDWSGALAALTESFLNDDPAQGLAGLRVGVYHAYGTGPGDRTNDLYGRRDVLMVHPSVAADIQPGDQRLDRKTEQLPAPVTDPFGFVTVDRIFRIYGSVSAPIPIIRNEELLLLRAEARLQTNDLDGARADINLVRAISGGLAPIDQPTWETTMSAAERLDELLYNRRYSLLFEGGHRWIDLRRYDRLDELPNDHPSFKRFKQFPFPKAECDPRSPTPAGCEQVAGF